MAFSPPLFILLQMATEVTSPSGVTTKTFVSNATRIGAKRLAAPAESFNTAGERNQRVTTVQIEIHSTPYTREATLDDKILMGGDLYTILDIDAVTRQPVALILTVERA